MSDEEEFQPGAGSEDEEEWQDSEGSEVRGGSCSSRAVCRQPWRRVGVAQVPSPPTSITARPQEDEEDVGRHRKPEKKAASGKKAKKKRSAFVDDAAEEVRRAGAAPAPAQAPDNAAAC